VNERTNDLDVKTRRGLPRNASSSILPLKRGTQQDTLQTLLTVQQIDVSRFTEQISRK
jgi:hypothetical protein